MKKVIYNVVFALISIFNINSCQAQNIDIAKYTITSPDYSFIPNDAVDITSYFPRNYVTDASVDYTAYLQKGIDENKIVKMPNFPILVNTKGIMLTSDSKVYFQTKSKLKIMPNDKQVYQILRIIRVENVEVYNPSLEGDKYTHLDDKGQWGMGISIQGSTNITLYSPKTVKCWGDGIYIGDSGKIYSKNIKIYNAVVDDNRRNGISIVSVDNLLLESPIIANTNLQNPQCGIDIEPNNNHNVLKNIVINSPLTLNNNNCGIMLSTGSIMGKSEKEIDITIRNHHDIGSRYSVGHVIVRHPKRLQGETVRGEIIFENSIWEKNIIQPFRFFDYQKHEVITTFKNLKIINKENQIKDLKEELLRHKNILYN